MTGSLEYIDAYFNQELDNSERLQFEARCSSDESFAAEVAFYISARQAARDALLDRKKQEWRSTEDDVTDTLIMKPVKKPVVLKWVPYAAAACLVFIIAGYFLFYQPTPQRLATKYINDIDLSQTMDASHDSLQTGIANYKSGNYLHALALFEGVKQKDATNTDAKKYAGLTYLKLKDYDKALQSFRELAAMKGLYSNSGDILTATTLLLRNQPGDDGEAKQLLLKVVKENEEGSKEASEILKNW